MEIKHEITDLADAVRMQCGLMATATHSHHVGGTLTVTTVQICLASRPQDSTSSDWLYWSADTDQERINLRAQLADFIADNRKEAA